MEVLPLPPPLEREEEEVTEGMDLETTRRKKSHNPEKFLSPTCSSESSVTSESSDSSFEYFASMNNNNNNGQNFKITEEEVEAEVEKEASFEEPKIEEKDMSENNGAQNYEKVVSFSSNEGTNGFSVEQNGNGVPHSIPENDSGDNKEMDSESNGSIFSRSPETAVGFKDVESLLNESSNAHNSEVQKSVNKILISTTTEIEEPVPVEEDFDVERVIEKQETHDLFCPNCNSCITKRVILRRRKRKLREISSREEEGISGNAEIVSEEKAIRAKLDDSATSNGGNAGVVNEVVSGNVPSSDGGAVDAITCLSCFSIFIPSREGFLWWRFGRKPADITTQQDGTTAEPPQEVAPPTGSSSSPAELGTGGGEGRGNAVPLWMQILQCCQPREGNKPESPEPAHERAPELEPSPPLTSPDGPEGSDHDIKPPMLPSGGQQVSEREIKPPSMPSDETPVQPKPEPPITPDPETQILPKPLVPIAPDPDDDTPLLPESNPPSIQGTGSYVIVPMPEEQPEPQPPETGLETAPNIKPDITTPLLGTSRERPRSGVSALDIIKAIVYGGLLECITSLSVIASAAGGDATTLNIVALGLANVFGGLIVLLHNLRVLNHEHTPEHYEEQLGRPGHYLLHSTIAIISYLFFGLMPPVVFGFTFRKSDDKDLKLITLAAASLFSLLVLSTAKAYVRRPPKAYIQTVLYYVTLGVMVSGLGYVAGDLINEFLKKLGVFDSRSTVEPNAWSSY